MERVEEELDGAAEGTDAVFPTFKEWKRAKDVEVALQSLQYLTSEQFSSRRQLLEYVCATDASLLDVLLFKEYSERKKFWEDGRDQDKKEKEAVSKMRMVLGKRCECPPHHCEVEEKLNAVENV